MSHIHNLHNPELWTNCWPKNYLCYELKRISSLYKKYIVKPFESPENSAERIQEEMLQNPHEYSLDLLDEADFYCEMENRAYCEYLIITDMQYRSRLTWICCILEMWEQNLSQHILQDFYNSKIQLTESQKDKLFNGFLTFEKIFSEKMCQKVGHQCILQSFPRYKELKELHLLVNAIKHGRGSSLSKLYKEYPRYKCKDSKSFAFEGTTIYTKTLNVVDDDFYRFCDVLIDFWKWIPEHIVITNIAGI